MGQITGLGGIFYKVADIERTKSWYREMLGIDGEWGVVFPYKQDSAEAYSVLSPFKTESDYFDPSTSPFMINFRVDDLETLLDVLEAKGVAILGRQEEEYGKFAWILDCDGVKLELWEQKGPAPAE